MSYVISFCDFSYIYCYFAWKNRGWLGGIDVKWFFLSNLEIIWNKNRIFAHSIINKNDRNEETDSYDYGNIRSMSILVWKWPTRIVGSRTTRVRRRLRGWRLKTRLRMLTCRKFPSEANCWNAWRNWLTMRRLRRLASVTTSGTSIRMMACRISMSCTWWTEYWRNGGPEGCKVLT